MAISIENNQPFYFIFFDKRYHQKIALRVLIIVLIAYFTSGKTKTHRKNMKSSN